MRLGIIGMGVVGNAVNHGLLALGHEISTHDIKLHTSIEIVKDTEIVFVCVPSPSTESGACDTSIIESVIAELDELSYTGIVAIRSTVVPGFTEHMSMLYSKLTICIVPEFLRERCAIDDFVNQHNLLAIGTNDTNVYNKVVAAHGHYPKQSIKLTPTEAELLKYFNNVYAALRISFANVMYEVATKFQCDYTTVKNAYIMSGKATDIYLDANPQLRGYAGPCLPKDINAMSMILKQLNLNYDLIDAIHNDNEKFNKTVFPGMRYE